MLNHYNERHHEQLDTIAEYRRQLRVLENRATSLLRTSTNLEAALRTSRESGARMMRENDQLVELIVDITRDFAPARAQTVGSRLLEITRVLQPTVIDLTADSDEELE